MYNILKYLFDYFCIVDKQVLKKNGETNILGNSILDQGHYNYWFG